MAANPPYERLRAAEDAARLAFSQATKVHAIWASTGANDVLVEVWHGKAAVVWNPTPERVLEHPRDRANGRRRGAIA